MSFFSVGNLLTLGITALAFILYHQLTRRNASGLGKLREYIKSQKEELSVFVAGKEAAVKDLGTILEVDQKSAKELLNRISLTEADLKEKADAVAKIDERITGYDSALEELVRMTGRVEENMKRIQDEGVFVESALKRVGQAQEKLDLLEKRLAGAESRFEAESGRALNEAVASSLADFRSALADLESSLEGAERRVEDHRDVLERAEKDREEGLARAGEFLRDNLARLEETVKGNLAGAEAALKAALDGFLSKAAEKAEKMEDAALVKLRDQALDRAKRFQETVEERLQIWQETTKNRVGEARQFVADFKESWQKESEKLGAEEKARREEFAGTAAALDGRLDDLESRFADTVAGLEALLSGTVDAAKTQAEALAGSELERWRSAVAGEDLRIRALLSDLRDAAGKEIGQIQAAANEEIEKWRRARDGEEERARQFLAQRDAAIASEADERERSFREAITEIEGRLRSLAEESGGLIRRHEEILAQGLEDAAGRARTQGEEEFRRWTNVLAETNARWREEAERSAREQQEAAAAAAREWREAFQGDLARWRDNLDADFSLWRGGMESAWADLRIRTETAYRELEAARETEASGWREAEARWNEVLPEISQAIADMQNRLAGAEKESSETLAALYDSLNTRAEELRSAQEETSADLREFLAGTGAELREAQRKAAGDMQAALSETVAHIRERIAEVERQSSETAASLRNSLDAASAELRAAGTETIAETQAALAASLAEIRERLAGAERESSQAAADLRDSLESLSADLRAEQEKSASDLRDSLDAAGEELRSSLGETVAGIRERLAEAERENSETAASLRNSLDTGAEELRAAQREAAAEMRAALAETTSGIREQLAEAERESSETAASLRNSLETGAEELRNAQAAAAAKIQGQLAELERQSSGTAAELKNSLEEMAGELRAARERTARELRESLDAASAELRNAIEGTGAEISAALGETAARLRLSLDETDRRLQKELAETSVRAGQQILEESDARLEAYRAAQAIQFRNLELAADDASRLERELRRHMEESENRVRQDFALFESASAEERNAASAAFEETIEGIRNSVAQTERQVEALKEQAWQNVSEKLDIFEEDFAGDLVKRGDAIQEKLEAWQETQNRNLAEINAQIDARRGEMELSAMEEIKNRLAEQRERSAADLERLKSETDAFGEGIRHRIAQSEEALDSFRAGMTESLAEARSAADSQVKAELGRFSLSMSENLKLARRDMEEWQEGITAQIRETDQLLEELNRKSRELSTDGDERLAAVRASIAEVNRQIQKFVDQTKLFDQADALKMELERRIEDLRGDLNGLDQRRAEASELENQFSRIKRLEDEINAKMTRFLSEQRRIELMEADFNRLIQTSQSVEEKLGEVSASDDSLQAIQVQIRKINDALAETEEKYRRIEKKNQTLETVNLGVDRNFKTLQETEGSLKTLAADLGGLRTAQEQIRLSLEKLRAENEQAQAAADRLTILEQDLSTIEERIKAMQVAREWIAQAETRMERLNRDMQEQLKLIGNITREEGDGPARGGNPESIAMRENVNRLHRQGWKDAEIAKTLKLSIGEVKLILETPLRKGE